MTIWDVCLTHDPVYGGIHRSVGNFARALDARILSFDDGRADRSGLADERPVVRIACRPRFLNRSCHVVTPAMAAEAEAHVAGADLLVVHSLFRGHAPWAARWCRAHGRPYLDAPDGCLDPWAMRRRGLGKRLWLAAVGRRFLDGAARVVFASRREWQKAVVRVPESRAAIVAWPVSLPSLGGHDAARAAFRAAHAIPESARVLLFVGRLHPLKRPGPLIDAFLRADVPDCHLVVAGMEEGVTVAGLRAFVPPAAAARVHVVGPLMGADLAAAHHAADGFVSRSHRENFGYAFAEALGYGLPAIVSPGHDLAHDITADERSGFPCGWLLPDDSLEAAVAAIRDFAAASPDRLASLGAAGRTWVGDRLSFDRFRDEIRRVAADAHR